VLKQVATILLNTTNSIIKIDKALENKKTNNNKSTTILKEVSNNFSTFLIFCLFILIFKMFLNFALFIFLKRQS